MYLIRLDAADVTSVIRYVEHADAMLDQMEEMMLAGSPC
jgi:hypothetical protein